MAKLIDKYKPYLDFMRFCIHEDAEVPESAKEIDWEEMLHFAEKQSIVGVMFRGIKRLTSRNPHPSAYQLAMWGTAAEAIAEDAQQAFSDAFKAIDIVYKTYGHRCCVLKGQGNALMYPDPYMRTSGDIDLWIAPNKGEGVDDIIRLCRIITPGCEVVYHHSHNDNITKTFVELHFRPSYSESLFYNRRLQQWFQSVREEQFRNIVALPNQLGKICMPTDSFNRVFQLSHMMKHLVYEGIGVGLRHVIDYYYLLRRGATDKEKAEFKSMVKRLGMSRFARGIMAVMQDTLGLEEKYLLIEPDRRLGKFMTREILLSGNFGHDDKRFSNKVYSNPFLSAVSSIRRGLRFLPAFPLAPLEHTTWILWWHFIGKKHAAKIIKRKRSSK